MCAHQRQGTLGLDVSLIGEKKFGRAATPYEIIPKRSTINFFFVFFSYDKQNQSNHQLGTQKEKFAEVIRFVEHHLRHDVGYVDSFADPEKNKLTFEVSKTSLFISLCSYTECLTIRCKIWQ